MTARNYLSVPELQSELNLGKATVKFLLNRFDKWISHKTENGRRLYSSEAIMMISSINEKLESGIRPSQIEKNLESETHSPENNFASPDPQGSSPEIRHGTELEDIRFSPDGVALIKSLFTDISTQQKRIALAHEKRAQAEERKAVAIEKRAIAEENKAQAMNNIATALQEMNQTRTDFNTHQIAREAAAAIVSDEITDDSIENAFLESKILEHHSDDDTEDDASALDDLSGLSDLIDDTPETPPLEDLSDLLDDDTFGIDSLDSLENFDDMEDIQDLSGLITDIDPIRETLTDSIDIPPLDDSSIHDDPSAMDDQAPLDDLSLLVDPPVNEDNLDNLSLLLDPIDTEDIFMQDTLAQDSVEKPDDLSLLIDDIQTASSLKEQPVSGDDMTGLAEMDDLSKLITPSHDNIDASKTEMDDLSRLIDPPHDTQGTDQPGRPNLKPAISPKENLPEYKKAIMNIIIQLKNDGLSVEETTRRFNEDGVITLSGKDRWNTRAIAQIYKFIDAAR